MTDAQTMTHLTTVDEVIDALDGTSAVARLTHRSLPAVSNWRATHRINPRCFSVMTAELARRGYTADPTLWGQDALEAA